MVYRLPRPKTLACQAQLRKAQAGGGATVPAAPVKVVFEPLEPRLLMNADVLTVALPQPDEPDQPAPLLVQQIHSAVADEAEAAPLARIQIIDQTSGRILADQLRDQVSAIAIATGGAADRITVDLGSFGGSDPAISLATGLGEDTLALTNATAAATIDGTTVTAGGLTITTAGIEQLDEAGVVRSLLPATPGGAAPIALTQAPAPAKTRARQRWLGCRRWPTRLLRSESTLALAPPPSPSSCPTRRATGWPCAMPATAS